MKLILQKQIIAAIVLYIIFSHILVEDDKIEKYKKILSKFVSLNPNVVHIQNHKVCL